jgi:hypothetical protein
MSGLIGASASFLRLLRRQMMLSMRRRLHD